MTTYGTTVGMGFDFDRMADVCVGALAEGGVIVWVVADATVDGSETGTSFRQALGFMERGLKLHDTMIYQKVAGMNSVPNRYEQSWEYMFVFANGVPETANLIKDRPNITAGSTRPFQYSQGRNRNGAKGISSRPRNTPDIGKRTNVWRYSVGFARSNPGHPATFPHALAKDHITTWTNPGDLVVDPMAGSGTVSRAAKDLGRDSIAIEIHEPYVDLIRRVMVQEVMGVGMTRRKINPSARAWTKTRQLVLERDGYRCQKCGKAGRLEVHHVVELSQGGNNEQGNLTTYCRSCHIAHHRPAAPTEWDALIATL